MFVRGWVRVYVWWLGAFGVRVDAPSKFGSAKDGAALTGLLNSNDFPMDGSAIEGGE